MLLNSSGPDIISLDLIRSCRVVRNKVHHIFFEGGGGGGDLVTKPCPTLTTHGL